MGDFYDPEHPTESGKDEETALEEIARCQGTSSLTEPPLTEEEDEAKNEDIQKTVFNKPATFKALSSSRFLPKGTKSKVNLEQQGRQKVSFSFSFTKKTLQNRLLPPLGNEKQNDAPSPLPMLNAAEHITKLKMEFTESTGSSEEFSPPKPKVERGKIHFKKHLISVTNKLPVSPPPLLQPSIVLPSPVFTSSLTSTEETLNTSTESETSSSSLKLTVASTAENAPSFVTFQNPLNDDLSSTSANASENLLSPEPIVFDGKQDIVSTVETQCVQRTSEKDVLLTPKENSHYGKEEKSLNCSQTVKSNPSPEKASAKSKFSHSDGNVLGSESDGDSVQTSSSHRSQDLKHAASKERDSKRSSGSLRNDDTGKYSSSRSKSGKDEKHFSYSKSDRESKYSYSHSRSERDRRRSRSRSGSRSKSDRVSKGSSSYSRSDRSHYYESERRYHRSSPYRTRYSRSYTDSKARDSSDSDDDYRRSYSKSSESRRPSSSSHSSSYRDSRNSYHSKYERTSKRESSYDNVDRKERTSSRSEKDNKKASEPTRKGSPQKETESRGGSSNSKADYSVSSSSRSNSSKTVDVKQDYFNSGSKSSKWDVEKKLSPIYSGKEEHKTFKKEELFSVTFPVHTKTVLPEQQQTPHLYSNKKNIKVSLIHSPSFDDEFNKYSKKIQGMITSKRAESQSPVQENFTMSPKESWEFVTLSSTDDVMEEEDVLAASDNCVSTMSVPVVEDSKEISLVASSEVENTCEPETILNHTEITDSGSGALDDETNESQLSLGPGEIKSACINLDNSKLLTVTDTENQELVLNGSKDSSLPCNSNNTSFSDYDTTPADESKQSEPVQNDENNMSFTEYCADQQITVTESLISERPNVLENTHNDLMQNEDIIETNDPPISINSVQSQDCHLLVDGHVLKNETDNDSPTLASAEINQVNELMQTSLVHEHLEVSSVSTVSSQEESSVVNQQSAEQESVVEEVNMSNDLTWQTEVHITSDKENMSEENVPSDTQESSIALDKLVVEIPPKKCDNSKKASVFISAVRDYYSDTEESNSDESDTEDCDSDDSSMPRCRLHSVVVVPKNSTIVKEETCPSSSPCHQGLPMLSDNEDVEKPEQMSSVEHLECVEKEDKESSNLPSKLDEGPEVIATEQSGTLTKTLEPNTEQHQPDGVVSTSQPEGFVHANGDNSVENNAEKEPIDLNKESSHQHAEMEPPPHPSNFESSYQQPLPSSAGRPDSRQEIPAVAQTCAPKDFSKIDGFQTTDLSSLGWDFSQPEKPSSTYQQPDSSYVYSDYLYQQDSEEYDSSKTYREGNGYWHSGFHNKGSKGHYERSCDPIPDSVTNCYEEDEDYTWRTEHGENLSFQPNVIYTERLGATGSVQAHEISSNSTKEPVQPIKKREAPVKISNLKDRGPPKKRRQEVESESESDLDLRDKNVKVEANLMDSLLLRDEPKGILCCMDDFRDTQHWKDFSRQRKMPPFFDLIEENVYLTERKKNKCHRDIKRMQCECPPLSKEERAQGKVSCGEDCLNRLLMIECSSRCPNGDYCSNRRFQRKQHADVEVLLTDKKGWGLRAGKELSPNAFVLEYCGEVLDHKEFKARVKEYARCKNIHYYFMALKNDEIIDATQKGNCSRFMNHSCEPNCETQKWTVNGQLRVGFFTTRVVPAGSELTFDYQFQRYGKEAQKCFCGSANCRGYIGGENRVSIRAAGGKMKKERSRKKDSVDGELEALLENGEGLSDKNQVLSLSRLMVRIETLEQKLTCLKLIKNTQSQSCLKFFLECHGLSLLWIWMAELGDSRGNTNNSIKLQLEIIKTLELLPIPNKNMLEESKILPIIQRWSQTKTTIPQLSEGDGYSSENTSRAHTPLNTPANTPDPAVKINIEHDGETPKKLILRRLKIISENSMDSAVSDAASEVEVKEVSERSETLATSEPKDVQLSKDEDANGEVKSELQEQTLEGEQPHEPRLSTIKTESDLSSDLGKAAGAESNGLKGEENSAVETPSQDEEEGVSDVESERSQEQVDKTVDMSDLAVKLLEGWKDLKEVYRIPKKSQAEKEMHDRWRESSGPVYQTPHVKGQGRERDSERQSQRKRRQSPSPPPPFYERNPKRGDDRYDTPVSSKKKGRNQERKKLSTEERRKLFEQEVAQREAQKQQQQMQNLGIASPIPYESIPYNAQLPPPFITYPQGYPHQPYLNSINPNAGKVLLPTPPVDMSPNSYDPSQAMAVNPAMVTPQQVPMVQHVAAPMDISTQQYVAQSEALVPQEPNMAVIPGPPPNTVPAQSYGVWDPNHQAVAVQQQSQPQYSPAPSQSTIYYQGQPCQTVYGVTTPYPQTAPPIVQSYPQPGLQYIPNQQIYAPHPQGLVMQQAPIVTTIVDPGQPQALQQPEMVLPANNILDLPPPSPPKPKTIVLPPEWKTARDPEGKIYYYHVITRQTQWDPPSWDSAGEDGISIDNEAEMDLGTPTYDENPMKSSKKAKTAEADTSSELAKKSKEVFRKEMSQFIVQCLNPYRKPDCKMGRINTTEDFKHLARKLTHGVMNKELKYCKNPEDLDCNENVKHKTKEYIKKYMQKFGSIYKPKEDIDFD
ncbi:histone-lysine N-methyltransferase SETD2 isoform X2 [Bombina bombina]|uniref:histone-lysine N-methyltransferase SETD2 isoform X2 n=1 Tax=Bombina bombina TaxID=8345 RepID=UPI00235A7F1A|nr:histone-lysine N-methyltransferase SETD2 isoform X2 [Bombina bombina]